MDSERRSITFLSKNFYPEQGGTAQLLTDLTTALADRGAVSVLSGYPNYHEIDRNASVTTEETYEGVDIRRIFSTRFDKDVLPLRIINWLSFTLLVLLRLLVTRAKPKVLFVVSSPPILPVVTWIVKRVRGVPYVYVIHDMYPDMAVALDYISEGGIVHRLWEGMNRAIYRDADRIVVLGDSMKQRLVEKAEGDRGFDPDKIVVIQNWEDAEAVQPKPKSESEFAAEYGTRDAFTLVYGGNIGRFHDLMTAIQAIERLEADGRTDIQLIIIGEGAQKDDLIEYVEDHDIENVTFAPIQPVEQLTDVLNCGDASLVSVKESVKGMCVSSKFYSSLAIGDPILGVVPAGDEIARVVEDADCGAHVEPGDVEAAKTVLERWADDPELTAMLGENARHCLETEYTIENAAAAYVEVYDNTVAQAA